MSDKIGSDRSQAVAILVSVVLMTITMGIHPAGGGIDHLRSISSLIVFTHTIAIISVPVLIYGILGFTRRVGPDSRLADAGLISFACGLFAVIAAAALNGLALPIFVGGLEEMDGQALETAGLILRYGFSLNQAFDIVFIIFSCGGIALWSLAIFNGGRFPVWFAVIGAIASVGAIATLGAGFVMTDLSGFRIFMAGLIAWLGLAGLLMLASPKGADPSA